jgi:type I restriction enzyme M protein
VTRNDARYSTNCAFWLKDESLEDSANLPDPDIIAAEIVEDLQAALTQFAEIANDLKR